MIGKYVQRYRRWQQTVPLVSPFVVCCGVIAVIYFFYRIVLVVSPAVMLERAAFQPTAGSNVVCGDDENDQLQDPRPILSAGYQKRIHGQRALTPNLAANPGLTKTNPETSEPAGYSRSVENKDTTYGVLHNGATRFLRVETKKLPPKGAASPAWQMDAVPIKKDNAYAYSFWYRSGVPIDVSIEYVTHSKHVYSEVTTLSATRSWQQFAAHFNNSQDASTFRVNLSLHAAGWLDTRGFDIHQIPDARLGAGLVTVAFDDGWQSVSDKAFGLLKKYGIRSTQYVITDVAGGRVPGYMNFDTLKKLKAAGHEIGSHTLTHCNQTMLKPPDIERNAISSKRALEQQQLGPITSFAYPLGQYDSKTQAVYEKYYPLIRTSDYGYNDRFFDETNIHSMGVTRTTSDAEFASWLDGAKRHRVWVVLTYHRVDADGKYSVTSAQLDRQLRMVKESGLKVLPLSEAAAYVRR